MKVYIMSEMQKALAGQLYSGNNDKQLIKMRMQAKIILHQFNHLPPDDIKQRQDLLKKLFGKIGNDFVIEGPLHCDYGFNTEIGDNFYANVNLVILDCAKIKIGNNVMIAPNVGLYAAGHPIDKDLRVQGLEFAKPITIGDNVWIGGSAIVLPGVTIGDNSIIGGGSVVTKSIPANVIAVGNPCKVIKALE